MSGSEMVYAIGDQVNINCTSSKSYPAAELRWYINNQPVSFLVIYVYYFKTGLKFAHSCVREKTGKRWLKCPVFAICLTISQNTNIYCHSQYPRTDEAILKNSLHFFALSHI